MFCFQKVFFFKHCKPLKTEFIKDYINFRSRKKMDDQIKKLQSYTVIIQVKTCRVRHKLNFAMVDGKLCNVFTDMS